MTSATTARASAARHGDGDASPSQEQRPAQTSALEWIVAVVGLLLVLGTVAFMVLDAMRGEDGPPRISVRADSVIALGDVGYLVSFTAANRGEATAASVGIVGELRDAAGIETSRARLDYVPGRSERRGGLLFRRDPRAAALRVSAEGYQEP